MAVVYCHPKIGRSGLGNCMLPWARAVIFARRHNLPVLAPRWVQPRIGAFLRREKKTRLFIGEFTNAGYIGGFRRGWILATLPHEPESQFASDSVGFLRNPSSRVVEFAGLGNYFRDLWGHHRELLAEFQKIVARPITARVAELSGPFIAMHVRRGDRVPPGVSEEELSRKIWYTPLSWFLSAAKTVRATPGLSDLPIYVVSDGWEHELRALLEVPNCQLLDHGTTAGDILVLAKAKLLFASGHSTFSMWASFFGQMPTLYCPGKWDERVFPPDSRSFEGEWQPGELLHDTVVANL